MGKTSADFMLAKVTAALEGVERTRTELIGLRYSLTLLGKEQAKTFPRFTPEGWPNITPNDVPPSGGQLAYAPRHGCEWNTKERNDLRHGLLSEGLTTSQLALRHRRTEGSINSEIGRWFNAFKGE